MLSSLYIFDTEDKIDYVEPTSCLVNANVIEAMQSDIDKLKLDLLALSSKVQAGEHDFKQSVESALNRKANFWQAVDVSLT